MLETKRNGRELMVKYTCQRCGKDTSLPYEAVMTDDDYGYLGNSKLPANWSELYSCPMCEDCTNAFRAFMKMGE